MISGDNLASRRRMSKRSFVRSSGRSFRPTSISGWSGSSRATSRRERSRKNRLLGPHHGTGCCGLSTRNSSGWSASRQSFPYSDKQSCSRGCMAPGKRQRQPRWPGGSQKKDFGQRSSRPTPTAPVRTTRQNRWPTTLRQSSTATPRRTTRSRSPRQGSLRPRTLTSGSSTPPDETDSMKT